MAGERILTIDDEPSIVRFCQRALTDAGAHNYTTGGGLVLSVLIPDQDAKALSYLQVASTIAALKPDCGGCLWQLAREYEGVGDRKAANRERKRIATLTSRNALLEWFQ